MFTHLKLKQAALHCIFIPTHSTEQLIYFLNYTVVSSDLISSTDQFVVSQPTSIEGRRQPWWAGRSQVGLLDRVLASLVGDPHGSGLEGEKCSSPWNQRELSMSDMLCDSPVVQS